MDSRRIENLKIVPTHLVALLKSSRPETILPLRILVLGGEALNSDLVHQIKRLAPDCRVFNHYGPTETTVGVISGQASEEQQVVRLGSPLAGVRLYILDANLQPVPKGIAGEIFVGGESLARGYLSQPESTATSYLPDPLSTTLGARIYRTGDRGLELPDGVIAFLGRTDSQVKLHGHRIELGEIEASLRETSGCAEVAALIREDEPGGRRLVAYIATDSPLPPESEVRSRMAQTLPPYMLPSAFVRLANFPLTPNGKLDRQSLPAPEHQRLRHACVEPRNAIEASLSEIWSRVLRTPRIGVTDNFFELGGDSILSIQIVARARQKGIPITTRQLFENPTISALAALVPEHQAPEAAEIQDASGSVPLTPVQRRFFALNDLDPHHYNQAIMLTLPVSVKPEILEQSLKAVVRLHDQLRARFHWKNDEWHQSIAAFDNGPVIQTIDLSGEPDLTEAVEQQAAAWQTRFDIERGPLFRAVFFQTRELRPPRLLLLAHHLIVDGVTWRILLEDIEIAYHDLEAGRLPELAKTASYREWASALIRYADSDALENERGCWRSLEDRPAPQLRHRLKTVTENEAGIGTITGTLDIESTRTLLRDLPVVHKAGIQDALLSSLVRSTVGLDGNAHVWVELEGHGREEAIAALDTSRTAGWFTSHFPLVLTTTNAADAATTLAETKEQMRAVPNAGVGFGLLQYLRSEAFELPPMEVSFNYLGQLDNVLPDSTLFSPAPESVGPTRSPRTRLPYLLVFSAHIAGGSLRFSWAYDRAVVSEAAVLILNADFERALRDVVQLCSAHAILADRSGVEDILPLTPMQQGMLFHSLLEPRSGAYFGQFSCDLDMALNLAAFQRAWQRVVSHFAILRASIAWEGLDAPLLIVWRDVTLPFEVLDWAKMNRHEQETKWASLLQSNREQGFDFTKPPLMRIVVAKLAASRYRLLWINHHLLQDGWCRPIILQAFFAFYRSELDGNLSNLPPEIPWKNYIAWLQRQDQKASELFWRQELAGFRTTTPLGMERPDALPPSSSERHVERLRLSEDDTRTIVDSVRENGLTLNTLMQGAWGLLLSRHSNRTDVVFGATVSGRPAELEGAERMVGLFINTLPVRVRVKPEIALVDWLRELQNRQAAARQFEFSPLVEVRNWSEIPRDKPLFESIVVFENYPIDEAVAVQSASMRAGNLHVSEPSNFQLGLVAVPGRELQLRIGYDPNRFDIVAIGQLMRDLSGILRAMASGMAQPLRDLQASVAYEPDPLEELYKKSNLSRNQLLVWIDEQRRKDSRIYNGAYAYTIHGAIDPHHFEAAFTRVVEGTGMLRSIFVEREGVPWREVLSSITGGFEVVDASTWPEQVPDWLTDRVRVPFRLHERLFDCVLLKLAEDEWTWFLNIHHIGADAWSFQVIFRAMEELYRHSLSGSLHQSFELPDYGEFVQNERAVWSTDKGRTASRYWLRKLAEDVPPVAFWGKPVNKKTARVQRRRIELGPHRTKLLKDLANRPDVFHKSLDVTLYNLLATVVFAWLYRTTQCERLSLGSPFHNRRGARSKETVGLVMQVLFLRISVHPNDTFMDLLQAVVAEMSQVMQHREFVPGNSRPGAGKAYEAALNYHNSSYLSFTSFPVDVDRAFSGEESESIGIRAADFGKQGNLVLHFDLHCDVFTPSQREQLMNEIVGVVDSFIDAPDRPINNRSVLSPEMEHHVLALGESSQGSESSELVPVLIGRYAASNPAKTALVLGSQRMTYGELDRRSNQVAHYLLQLGIKQESIVGVFSGRSFDTLAAVLGIWKAGAAYLPLDPKYPVDRLKSMVNDANAPVVLVERQLAAHVAVDGIRIVSLDNPAIHSRPATQPLTQYGPDNLAYLLYTSGSTGRPKGVMVSHRAYAAARRFWQLSYELDSSHVHLQVASFSFDVFAGDLARSLANGGTLVLCPEEVLLDPPQLHRYMSEHRVDAVEFTPALLRNLVSYLEETDQSLPFLRLLVAGSDTWTAEDFNRTKQLCGPATRLINSYGVTEACIDSTFFENRNGWDGRNGTVPIGWPFPGVRTYVVDKTFHPVGPGVPGEICIGGDALARGYGGMPVQTALKFVCDPFAADAGARMYRTGDAGCWNSGGSLQFLGRLDEQLKIRGHRVELGEIESVLRKHPEVREVVLVTSIGTDGNINLKACIVPTSTVPPSAGALREFACKHLPEFMIPAGFAFLDEFPATPNGKVDRRALAKLDAVEFAAENVHVAPANPAEERMAAIWSTVLKRARIGTTDNFFALGGHSLLATVLISRVRSEFKVDIPLRAIFESPTIATLCTVVCQLQSGAATTKLEEALQFVESLDEDALQALLEKSSRVARTRGAR
jgi:amino acid adenylation domain-containing protein/non-ribosomal peptide synthase protein (TIGR01720 family)